MNREVSDLRVGTPTTTTRIGFDGTSSARSTASSAPNSSSLPPSPSSLASILQSLNFSLAPLASYSSFASSPFSVRCLLTVSAETKTPVPSDMPLYNILNEFQKGSSHMGAVVKVKEKKNIQSLSNGEMPEKNEQMHS